MKKKTRTFFAVRVGVMLSKCKVLEETRSSCYVVFTTSLCQYAIHTISTGHRGTGCVANNVKSSCI